MAKQTFSVIFVKYFWYIIFIVVFAVAAISYWGVAKPKLDRLGKGKPLDTKPYLEIIKKQEIYLANLQSLINSYDNLNLIRLEKLSQIIGDKPDMSNTLAMVVRLVERYGLKINSIGLAIGEEQTKIDLTVSGKDYFVFKEFLKEIESSARLIDLTSLNFSPNNYGLQLVIYHLK
jgi:Tfp pilus assembly protein PilO